MQKIIDLEQGLQKEITKLKNILEGLLEPYIMLCISFSLTSYPYIMIYNMCTQRPPHDYSQQLYGKLIKNVKESRLTEPYLKNVLDIFVVICMGQMDHYENDFEPATLKDTATYYSRKASNWILEDSCPDYMLKECLRREKDRVAHYLHSSGEPKLLEKVQHELLHVYATQLLGKEHSGCHAFLRDDKVEDLSRMFRVFSKIPRGLDPVSNIFKQAEKKDVVGLQEKVIELHDKYLAYLNNCFQNHTLFHTVCISKEHEDGLDYSLLHSYLIVFSSAELLATFCDNILKKGGSEKLRDEATEETLEKVVKLLAYISDKDLFAEFYSANDDHERFILTKLEQQCGEQFTSKKWGMVMDLTSAKENQTIFEEYLCNNPQASPGIDLTMTLLTTGFWPSYKSFDLNLPAEMVKCVEVFREFYHSKTKHSTKQGNKCMIPLDGCVVIWITFHNKETSARSLSIWFLGINIFHEGQAITSLRMLFYAYGVRKQHSSTLLKCIASFCNLFFPRDVNTQEMFMVSFR
ncbi:hypothetical protein UlMin_036273 [Ulmus minor]